MEINNQVIANLCSWKHQWKASKRYLKSAGVTKQHFKQAFKARIDNINKAHPKHYHNAETQEAYMEALTTGEFKL